MKSRWFVFTTVLFAVMLLMVSCGSEEEQETEGQPIHVLTSLIGDLFF